jgi:molecular chaperone DnaJ
MDPMGYYEVLGLTPAIEIDEDEIKTAYRRLAMQYHPDRHISKDAPSRAAAAKQFEQLLKAYDTLKDPEQRALYNSGHLIEASLNL